MNIEMPSDLAEDMANKLGIYGIGDDPDDPDSHSDGCLCRCCFVISITRRIRESVANEARYLSKA